MSGHPGQVETERLLLVPRSDQYFDEFARICADGDVMHFISGGEPLSRQDVEQILRRTRSMWDE
jgi:molybdenum cofactor biosynthesis enzyme MoaA